MEDRRTPSVTITNIDMTSGPTVGGTYVTITGTNLNNATAVNFGSTAGVILSDSATQIVVQSPAEPAGTVDSSFSPRRNPPAPSISMLRLLPEHRRR